MKPSLPLDPAVPPLPERLRPRQLAEIVGQELRFKAVWVNGQASRDAGGCPLDITPCATVETSKDLRVYDRVQERFPQAAFLRDHNASAYCGFPSLDDHGRVVAVTCLLDTKPREFTEEDQEILRVIGQRVAMEMERGKSLAERKNMERLALRSQLSKPGIDRREIRRQRAHEPGKTEVATYVRVQQSHCGQQSRTRRHDHPPYPHVACNVGCM